MNKIVCAATVYEVAGDFIVIADARHMFRNQVRVLELLIKTGLAGLNPVEVEQGFIDKFGAFHTREQAFIIAEKAGQITGKVFEGRLYSENLY